MLKLGRHKGLNWMNYFEINRRTAAAVMGWQLVGEPDNGARFMYLVEPSLEVKFKSCENLSEDWQTWEPAFNPSQAVRVALSVGDKVEPAKTNTGFRVSIEVDGRTFVAEESTEALAYCMAALAGLKQTV